MLRSRYVLIYTCMWLVRGCGLRHCGRGASESTHPVKNLSFGQLNAHWCLIPGCWLAIHHIALCWLLHGPSCWKWSSAPIVIFLSSVKLLVTIYSGSQLLLQLCSLISFHPILWMFFFSLPCKTFLEWWYLECFLSVIIPLLKTFAQSRSSTMEIVRDIKAILPTCYSLHIRK